jgi:hypothetical protein
MDRAAVHKTRNFIQELFFASFHDAKLISTGYVPGFEGADLGSDEGSEPWDADMQRGDFLMSR